MSPDGTAMTWASRWLPDRAQARQGDVTAIAMTVWGEARGEPPEGKLAVAQVIVNRCQQEKASPWEVVTRPWQFSAWNEDDPNRERIWEPLAHDRPDVWGACVWAALGAYHRWGWNVLVGTARHYLSTDLPRDRWPAWAKGREPDAVIGRHAFFRNIA